MTFLKLFNKYHLTTSLNYILSNGTFKGFNPCMQVKISQKLLIINDDEDDDDDDDDDEVQDNTSVQSRLTV